MASAISKGYWRAAQSLLSSFILLWIQAASAPGAGAQEVLGRVDFAVSCSEPAQVEFNRAVALLHHMTYPRAREAFENVVRIEPQCVMANWGIAMTLFQPLWPTRPGVEQLRRGRELTQAVLRSETITERERLLTTAVAAFFENPESIDYWQRIRRWETGMAEAHKAFPADHEVTAFYALAHLAAAPSDERAVREHSERAADLLASVYAANPDHPGAMHYLVHASDVPGRERPTLAVTRKYETAAPDNPHALHMPTHIHTRLGDWPAVIRGNLRAAEAALENPAGDQGQFVWDEFPHAIEYLVYAYLQQGADDEAERQLSRLHSTKSLEPTFKTAFHLASTRARYAIERQAWADAMSLVPRESAALNWKGFPWPEAVTWFARGLGAARERHLDAAREAMSVLERLESSARGAGEELFAQNIHVLLLEVRAWEAHGRGDVTASQTFMRQAAELEIATPKHAVTPAPTLPAHELWGDLLMEQHDPQQALAMYRRSLDLYPNRINSLIGAARAAAAAGDSVMAAKFYEDVSRMAVLNSSRKGIVEARAYSAGRH